RQADVPGEGPETPRRLPPCLVGDRSHYVIVPVAGILCRSGDTVSRLGGPIACGSGGTGRRASLRSLFPQGSGGSSPLLRSTSAGCVLITPLCALRSYPSLNV